MRALMGVFVIIRDWRLTSLRLSSYICKYLLYILKILKSMHSFSQYSMLSLWITATSYNDQPTGWDTPPMCKIRGDNAVYFLENNKKSTGGLGALLSLIR